MHPTGDVSVSSPMLQFRFKEMRTFAGPCVFNVIVFAGSLRDRHSRTRSQNAKITKARRLPRCHIFYSVTTVGRARARRRSGERVMASARLAVGFKEQFQGEEGARSGAIAPTLWWFGQVSGRPRRPHRKRDLAHAGADGVLLRRGDQIPGSCSRQTTPVRPARRALAIRTQFAWS